MCLGLLRSPFWSGLVPRKGRKTAPSTDQTNSARFSSLLR